MQPLIQIKSLDKVFKTKSNNVNALTDINLDINEGDIYGIIGLSGAGKSTLVRCINYLEKPTRGDVVIGDKALGSLKGKDLRKLRQGVSMIFQHFNLLMQRSVEKNIMFPMEIAGMSKKDTKKRVKELLEIVGLSDKAKSYPAQLSGGQKQRVAIARALATNPKILLCDEATSALDPNTTKSILNLLKDINRNFGITIVMITHEMSVVESICSHVAIIDDGYLVENGKVEDIFSKPNTKIAKSLVYQSKAREGDVKGKRCIRIVFNGNSSFEPVIADMIIDCKARINILHADTRDIDGKAHGQMIIQLPEDKILYDKVIYYLSNKNVIVEELDNYVG